MTKQRITNANDNVYNLARLKVVIMQNKLIDFKTKLKKNP